MSKNNQKNVDETIHEPKVEVIDRTVVDETTKRPQDMIELGKFLMEFSKDVYLKDPTNPMYPLAKAQTDNIYVSLCVVFNQNAATVLSVPNTRYPELIELFTNFSIEVPQAAISAGATTTEVDLTKVNVPKETKEAMADELDIIGKFRNEPKPEEITDNQALYNAVRYYLAQSNQRPAENIQDALKCVRLNKARLEPNLKWAEAEEDEIFRELLDLGEKPGVIFMNLVSSIFVHVMKIDAPFIGHCIIKSNLPHIKDDIIAKIVRICINRRMETVESQQLKDKAIMALRGVTKELIDELMDTSDKAKEMRNRLMQNYGTYLEQVVKDENIPMGLAMKNLLVKINNCYAATPLDLYKEDEYPKQEEIPFEEDKDKEAPASTEEAPKENPPVEQPVAEEGKTEDAPAKDAKANDKADATKTSEEPTKQPEAAPAKEAPKGNPKQPNKGKHGKNK